jgi:hypothetical protein
MNASAEPKNKARIVNPLPMARCEGMGFFEISG